VGRAIFYRKRRVPTPQPERPSATLDGETTKGWSEPVFVAITAEPVIAAGESATIESKNEGERARTAAKPHVNPRNRP
jgi:hypothetical protein